MEVWALPPSDGTSLGVENNPSGYIIILQDDVDPDYWNQVREFARLNGGGTWIGPDCLPDEWWKLYKDGEEVDTDEILDGAEYFYLDDTDGEEVELELRVYDTESTYKKITFKYSPPRADGYIGRQYVYLFNEGGTITKLDTSGNVIATIEWNTETYGMGCQGLDGDVYLYGISGNIYKLVNDEITLVFECDPITYMAVDQSGNVYTSDGSATVKKYSSTGVLIWTANISLPQTSGLHEYRSFYYQTFSVDNNGVVRGIVYEEWYWNGAPYFGDPIVQYWVTSIFAVSDVVSLCQNVSWPLSWYEIPTWTTYKEPALTCCIDPKLSNYYVLYDGDLTRQPIGEGATGDNFHHLCKYSSNCDLIWDKQIKAGTGKVSGYAKPMALDKHGNSYVLFNDGSVVLVNDAGAVVWDKILFSDDSYEYYPESSLMTASTVVDFNNFFYGVPQW
jgi:hypothetical protein